MDLLDKKGKSFSATINGSECIGKIQVEGGMVYLCQDKADGAFCRDRLGYKYSWGASIGSDSDLDKNFVYNFKIMKEEEKKDDVLSSLPKYWAVKSDGSALYKNTLSKIFEEYYSYTNWNFSITGNYYGYDGRKSYRGTYHSPSLENFIQPVKILTLKELINLTTNNTNNLTINQNNYEKSSIKVQTKTSVITSGKRWTGNSISGGRSKAAISIGHLSNSAIYQ